jgi:hypothetical protein
MSNRERRFSGCFNLPRHPISILVLLALAPLSTGCTSVTQIAPPHVVSSETRLVRAGTTVEPTPLDIKVEPRVENDSLVLRVSATQACAYRPLTIHRRERTVRREASSTATGIEVGLLLTGLAMIVGGIVQSNKIESDAKLHPEKCDSETACSTTGSAVFTAMGIVVTAVAIPVLAVDSSRQSDTNEPVEDLQIAGKSTEIHPCGNTAWQGSEIEVRSSGPSGKARTDSRGEVRFPITAGWKGAVEIFVDGGSRAEFSL